MVGEINFWGNNKQVKKTVKKKDMSWAQAKVKYPMLSPFKDADKDGVKNWLDCKPFDKKRHMTKYKDEVLGRTFQSKRNLISYGRPGVIKRIKKIASAKKKVNTLFDTNKFLYTPEIREGELALYELDKESIKKNINESLKKSNEDLEDDFYLENNEDYDDEEEEDEGDEDE